MSTIKLKDGDNIDRYFETSGSGTLVDPYRMRSETTLQDSFSKLYIVKFSNIQQQTTLATLTAKDDLTITVSDATGFAIGQYLTIYNEISNRVYFASVLSISVNDIGLDTPLDFEFPVGSPVSVGNTNMNVDGSVTPQVFGIRNPAIADIPLSVDISRLMFAFLTATVPELSDFGDITNGLTKGIVVRKVDGTYENIVNFKSNFEMKNAMYDLEIQNAANNAQNGLTGRFTFERLGQVVRIGQNEDLQIIIQDDLTSLTSLNAIAEGSEVTE
jgi:hypothetical protein